MFIELTDHLRCTAPHAEQFLVLLPGTIDRRRVVEGDLGCPVCGRVVRIVDGVADFGGGSLPLGETTLTPEAVGTLLGLGGPGGYVALVGSAARLADRLAPLLPGVRFVLVNPPEATPDTETASVLRAGRLPLKRGSMRGLVLGKEAGGLPEWVGDAAGAVLPGLRIVVEGDVPLDGEGVELMARAPGCWVARRLAQ